MIRSFLMVDLNSTLELLGPIGEKISLLTNLVSVLVGGVFGIYIILVAMRWWQGRQNKKMLKQIHADVRYLHKAVEEIKAERGKKKNETHAKPKKLHKKRT